MTTPDPLRFLRTLRRLWGIRKLRPYIMVSTSGTATTRPHVNVSVNSRTGLMTVFSYPADDAGCAHAGMNAKTLSHILGLPMHDTRPLEYR